MYKGLKSRDGLACLRDWLQCDVGSERKQGMANRWARLERESSCGLGEQVQLFPKGSREHRAF